ncbi:MSC_0621 family F1-like ATPase epsilon subunit [Mycoplasma sp. Mirounga ES2805-ORL]|uniref:MSC_0621 family F1-like ATPase epsilon subunit n=1 Tax=Mycoplasma sp. Mirounga ES2805-ORL TaxID=754514 RepID=UPI00197C3CA0|nr:hypothetical protein [Mycoplasma sp. Mirounga ES2805-ORL]QSF13621.1 hypothetical protein JXZ90_03065 [Mycoplasma sp. Mirounga ES2805-ORL]
MSRQTFKLLINYDFGKSIIFNKADIAINYDEEKQWIYLDSNSLGGFGKKLFRINDYEKNKTWYIFLENVSFIVSEKTIKIKTDSQVTFLEQARVKVDLTKLIKEKRKQIEYLSAIKKIGINIDNYLRLNDYKQMLYELELRQLFNLVEGDLNE